MGLGLCAGHPALGKPVINSDPSGLHEAPSAQQVINTAELQDYLAGQGAWAVPPALLAAGAGASAAGASRPSTPAPQATLVAQIPQSKALGEVVAELAKLSQKLKPKLASIQQLSTQVQQQQQHASEDEREQEASMNGDQDSTELVEEPDAAAAVPAARVPTAADVAAGTGAAPGADIIHTIPLKLAVVSITTTHVGGCNIA
jgi:hypothetical protein